MMPATMPETKKSARHGGNLKLARDRHFGSVSSFADPAAKSRETDHSRDWHGSCYITRAWSGVAPVSARKAKHGGKRNSAGRTSNALTGAQVHNLKASTAYAGAIGLPFNRMITIHWQMGGVPLADMAKATGHFLKLLGKALARHGCASAYVWAHENGEGKGGHVHILAHVPAEMVQRITKLQRRWLHTITCRTYQARTIKSVPIGGRLGMEQRNPDHHAVNLASALAYICKGAPQQVLNAHGIDRAHEPGGHIIGKRFGTSENIGAKARGRG
jgi:hypothetical protein